MIETSEGLIFRLSGYSHLLVALTYATLNMLLPKSFILQIQRAPRTGKKGLYYKFYNDEGMKLSLRNILAILF